MKRVFGIIIFIIGTVSVFGGYFDSAEDFRQNKLYDDAKREIIKIMYVTKEDIKPQGYFLLGDIDAEKGDYEGARKNWLKLKDLYPKSDAFKMASEKAVLLNICLYSDAPKEMFELYNIKMGMKDKEFGDAKDDLKARLNRCGIANLRIKGEFLAGELYKLELYFENYASYDLMKNIAGAARIEALKSYIDSRIDRDKYTFSWQKMQEGRVLQMTISDRKIYAKKYQGELDKGIEELRKIEKEKIRPVKSIIDMETEEKKEEPSEVIKRESEETAD